MAILALDFGGTSIKYGVWHNDQLCEQNSIKLPNTWETAVDNLKKIKQTLDAKYHLVGVGMSVPGAVDQKNDQIYGRTAIPYIHHRSITQELGKSLGIPVSMENDANCAALSEVWKGQAKKKKNVLFFVFGTGVGGAIISNGRIQTGEHFFGGEFGYMLLNEEKTFSEAASIVQCAQQYSKMTGEEIDGKELYARFERKDPLAVYLFEKFCQYSARGIYNLMVSCDPEQVLIGGAISKNTTFINYVNENIEKICVRTGATNILPKVVASKFGNESNLIGAVYNYLINN